tara:strand:+ start:371 stop:637 length:267 start_codon:yes stop_codon:yes gene_type:complete
LPTSVGESSYLAGGGGGAGTQQGATGGNGGNGGGGDGFGRTFPGIPGPAQPYTGKDGLTNTGGGGGGSHYPTTSKGGSGIVLISYPTS